MISLTGRPIAENIYEDLKPRIAKLQKQNIIPLLAVILVGDDPASEKYVAQKQKAAEKLSMKVEIHRYQKDVEQDTLTTDIEHLNQDQSVHGIIIQMPLPSHINAREIIDRVDSKKDVDGLTTHSMGALASDTLGLQACTAQGIMLMLQYYQVPVIGKHVVIIGRSNIVGKPLSLMMTKANATVTVCHSQTEKIEHHTSQADIVISAVGRPGLVTADMIKKGATLIDVGITRTENGLEGDVDAHGCEQKASAISPVPGGVGPMTVACLMQNLVQATESQI